MQTLQLFLPLLLCLSSSSARNQRIKGGNYYEELYHETNSDNIFMDYPSNRFRRSAVNLSTIEDVWLSNLTGVNITHIDPDCLALSYGYHCNYSEPLLNSSSYFCLRGEDEFSTFQWIVVDMQLYKCVTCFQKHHCLRNNTCEIGTTGPTCERCKRNSDGGKGYFSVGNSCSPCTFFVGPLVAILIFYSILLIGGIYHKLSSSANTKLKLIVHFLQLTYITLYIPFSWPKRLLQFSSFLRAADFNLDFLFVECYTSIDNRRYYFTWTGEVLLLAVTLIGALTADHILNKIMKSELDIERCNQYWMFRLTLRRIIALSISMSFMPLTIAAVRTQSCEQVIPGDYSFVTDSKTDAFLFDQDVSKINCFSAYFQFLNVCLTICFMVLVLGIPPTLCFFGVITWKWDLFKKSVFYYGGLLNPYKKPFAFWEATIMFRKLICALSVGFYPLSPVLGAGILMFTTLLYLIAVLIVRPYKPVNWSCLRCLDLHNTFDVVANIMILLLQIGCLQHVRHGNAADPGYNTNTTDFLIFDIVNLTLFSTVFIFWLMMWFMVRLEDRNEDEKELAEEWNDAADETTKMEISHIWEQSDIAGEMENLAEMSTRAGNSITSRLSNVLTNNMQFLGVRRPPREPPQQGLTDSKENIAIESEVKKEKATQPSIKSQDYDSDSIESGTVFYYEVVNSDTALVVTPL